MRYKRRWPDLVLLCVLVIMLAFAWITMFPKKEFSNVVAGKANEVECLYAALMSTASLFLAMGLTMMAKCALPEKYDYKVYSKPELAVVAIDKGDGEIHVFDMATIGISRNGRFLHLEDANGESTRVPYSKNVERSLYKYKL